MHEILLNKLRFYGINDKQYKLYKSYLEDRFQKIIIANGSNNDKVYSGWIKVTNGVPQGSILGPLLFIVYINDLPEILKPVCLPILFADDASVMIAHTNSIEFKKTINEVYVSLEDWFKKNLLSLNIAKTHYIYFSARKEVVRDIGKMGTVIDTINYTRFLGLNIEYSITWERHIDELIKKLCAACYNIRNMKSIVL
jgi:hypothetical protein